MKKAFATLCAILTALALTACVPDKNLMWSPDGKQAAVFGDDGNLYLCSQDGTLSEKLLEGVLQGAWLSDSSKLLLARAQTCTTWEEATQLLTDSDQDLLTDLTDKMYAIYSQNHDIEAAAESVLNLKVLSEEQVDLMTLYAKQAYPDLIEDEELEKDEPLSADIVLLETIAVNNGTIEHIHTITAVPYMIWDLRISPDDHYAAFTAGEVFGKNITPAGLYLTSLEEQSEARRIAQNANLFPDWSTDGKYLIYAASASQLPQEELSLGALIRQQVADAQGLLEELPQREELAGLIMNPLMRVRCLPDNSVVFSAMEVQLPSVAADMPETLNFFRFDPERPATLQRMFPRSTDAYLGEWSSLFEPSPDGTKIAFLDVNNRIAVITVSTGEMEHIPDSNSEEMLPAWRGNDELTCLGTMGQDEKKHNAVVIYSLDKNCATDLSQTWPDEVTKEIVDN